MSVCTFLDSDSPMQPVSPGQDYPFEVNIDTGEINDGGADDNFFLLPFEEADVYSKKKYGLQLEWRYTSGRATRLLDYIAKVLESEETVELWHVWLGDWHWYEYDERPVLREFTANIAELTPEDIEALDSAEIWNNKDKHRPSFYRLVIGR